RNHPCFRLGDELRQLGFLLLRDSSLAVFLEQLVQAALFRRGKPCQLRRSRLLHTSRPRSSSARTIANNCSPYYILDEVKRGTHRRRVGPSASQQFQGPRSNWPASCLYPLRLVEPPHRCGV